MRVFNTGKVQIGLAYYPDRRPYHDRDALLLQSCLLGKRPRVDWDGLLIVAGAVALVALFAAGLLLSR